MKKIFNLLMVMIFASILVFGRGINVALAEGLQEEFKDAVTLKEGVELKGNINDSEEKDRYVFIPSETKKYYIEGTGNLNTDLRVYNENFGLMDRAFTGGEGTNFRIELNLTKGKKYYLSVTVSGEVGDYGIIADKVPTVKIKGKIKLPEGHVVPEGGIEVTIKAEDYSNLISKDIVMNEGLNEAEYSIDVYKNSRYKISYEIKSSIEDEPYFEKGYVGDGKSVIDEYDARYHSVDEEEVNLDIALVEAVFISGEVSFEQESGVNENNIELKISAHEPNESYLGDKVSSKTLIFNDSKGTMEYRLKVLKNKEYHIYFKSKDESEEYPYEYSGYYRNSAAALSPKEAEKIEVKENDLSGIDVEVPSVVFATGKMTIPNGKVVEKYFVVKVGLYSKYEGGYNTNNLKRISFYKGESSKTFKLRASKNKDYVLEYNIDRRYEDCDYSSGVYNLNGTVKKLSEGTILSNSKGNMSNIEFQLIPKTFVKGTISLPDGIKAPSGGIEVGIDSGNWKHESTAMIPEGQSSVEYKCAIEPGEKQKIRFQLIGYNTPKELEGFFTKGYYSSRGIQTSEIKAEDLIVNSTVENIDFTFVEKKYITGKILLPEGRKAISDLHMNLELEEEHEGDYRRYAREEFVINQGEGSVEFSIPAQEGYEVKLKYQGWDYVKEYEKVLYYNSNGSGVNPTDGQTLVVGDDNSNIQFYLSERTGIKTTLTLPQGMVAPKGDLRVRCNYRKKEKSFWSYADLIISEGKNSVEYYFPVDKGVEYYVGYRVMGYSSPEADKYSDGFYSINGTVRTLEEATTLSVEESSIKDIEMGILTSINISGEVRVPNGVEIPEDGIEVFIQKMNESGLSPEKSQLIKLTRENPVAKYSLKVSKGDINKLRYLLKDEENTEFYWSGFYNETQMVYGAEDAKKFTIGNESIENVNITLLQVGKVSGIISMPEGKVAPKGGIRASIIPVLVDGNRTEYKNIEEVIIEEGKSSAAYSIKARKEQYRIKYDIGVSHEMLLYEYGYYAGDKTVRSIDDAEILDLNNEHKGIDLKIYNLPFISGTINFEESIKTPDKDIDIEIAVVKSEQEFFEERTRIISIKKGERSSDYIIPIYNDGSFKIRYRIINNADGTKRSGYYSKSGTVDFDNAEIFTISGNSFTDVNMVIKKSTTISGRIQLESGQSAKDNITLNVNVIDDIEKRVINNKQVIISKGESFIDYSIDVKSNKNYVVFVETEKSSDLVSRTFFGYDGVKYIEHEASVIDLKDKDAENINFVMNRAKYISGKIKLPEGLTVNQNSRFLGAISAKLSESYGRYSREEVSFSIQEGSNWAEYRVKCVPNQNYYLEYEINEAGGLRVARSGYYKKNGIGDSFSNADTVTVNEKDIDDIDILINKGVEISGKIILPDDIDLPDEGLDVIVSSNYSSFTFVTIPKGSTEVEYRLWENINIETKIEYQILNFKEDTKLHKRGYYTANGCIGGSEAAALINIGEEDISNLDLKLATVASIKGKIRLPEGQKAPSGGITIKIDKYIFINDEWKRIHNYGDRVLISEGQDVAEYSIEASKGSEYKLAFNIDNGEYLSGFYYSRNGNVDYIDQGECIDVGEDIIVLEDITLEKGIEVSGAINFPDDFSCGRDFSINIHLREANESKLIDIKGYWINSGERSKEYKFIIPKSFIGKEGKIFYNILTPNIGVVKSGYYSSEGIKDNEDEAEKLIFKAEGIKNADLNIEYLEVDDTEVTLILFPPVLIDPTIYIYAKTDDSEYVKYTNEIEHYNPIIVKTIQNGFFSEIVITGLKWDHYTKYRIETAKIRGKFYEKELTKEDQGKKLAFNEVEAYSVDLDSSNLGNQVAIDRIVIQDLNNSNNNQRITDSHEEIILKNGEYRFMVQGKIEDTNFEYIEDVSVSENTVVNMSKEKLAKITIDLNKHEGSKSYSLWLDPMKYNSAMRLKLDEANNSIYLTKGTYNKLGLIAKSKEGQEISYDIKDRNIQGDRVLRFSTKLKVDFTSTEITLDPSENWSFTKCLSVKDDLGNNIKEIEHGKLILRLKKESEIIDYRFNTIYSFDQIVAPSAQGTYEVSVVSETDSFKIESEKMQLIIRADVFSEYVDSYGKSSGESGFDHNKDENNDGIIDIFDLIEKSKER